MYLYIKAIHIIFIVTWFSGLFYVVRLFVYNTEANVKSEPEKLILQHQFGIMIQRLWLGITWPSAVITLILGLWLLWYNTPISAWLWVKQGFVVGLYAYHFSLHRLYMQQKKRIFNYSSQQLRIWNEVATLFLVSIVLLVVVKQSLSWIWGLLALVLFSIVLLLAIRLYKLYRKDKPATIPSKF
jgi:putative membrane protein